MKRLPASPCRRRAFSLVELLVAIAVLALMVALLASVLSASSETWRRGKARVDNFSNARSLLDLLAGDLQNGVYRGDLAAFPGSQAAFYTKRAGFVGGTNAIRQVSLVSYAMETNAVLQRADLGIAWNDPATGISFGNTNALPHLASATPRDTAEGVVGFRILFLDAGGRLSANYVAANGLKGFAIGVAVVDNATLRKMSPAQINTLQSVLQNQITGTNSIGTDWENYLNSGMDWPSYPAHLADGLRIFERYVYLR